MSAKRIKPKRSKSRKSSRTSTKTAKGKPKKKRAVKLKPRRRAQRGKASVADLVAYEQRGLGARSGGQSGDTQGLAANTTADSQSVEELLEEGQTFEAEVLNGIENAPDPDQSEVRTREVSEDDVPEEYREKD
jgi:hypothetical protein